MPPGFFCLRPRRGVTDEVYPGAVRMALHGRSVVVLNTMTPEEVLRANAAVAIHPKFKELKAVLDTLLSGEVPEKAFAFARMHLSSSRLPSIRSMVNATDGGPSPELMHLADKARRFCSAEQAEKLSALRGSRTEVARYVHTAPRSARLPVWAHDY